MSDNNIREYLEAETEALRKSFKIGFVVLLLLALVMVGYFEWFKSQTAKFLAPDNISTMMVSEVRRNLPTARDQMSQSLRQAAPDVIRFVIQTVVDEALPMVRDAAGALFKEYSRELAGFGTLAAVQSFEQIVQMSQTELAKAKETAEPGFYTPDLITAKLTKQIEAELAKRMNDRPEETAGTKIRESLNALHNINDRLKGMAGQKSLSRKDELGKKLITTWWTFLNRADPIVSAEDAMLNKSTKMPITQKTQPDVPGDNKDEKQGQRVETAPGK